MPLFTVLIPTHSHADTIIRSIASIQDQTEQDFELFVVGDGAPPRTDEIMREVCAKDQRIRYFPNPKGEGNGEAHRAVALQEAKGKLVCYLGDDDLWLPHHLAQMKTLLQQVDFAHTVQIDVFPNENIAAWAGDLSLSSTRQRMLQLSWNFFGPSCVGHTLSAYRRLPYGWRPKPQGMFSDLHMWRQWLNQDWCRFHSEPMPSMLRFPSYPRKQQTLEQRCIEMDAWFARSRQPDFLPFLQREVLLNWQKRTENLQDLLQLAKVFSHQQNTSLADLYYIRSIEASVYGFYSHWEYSQYLQQKQRLPEALNVIQQALNLSPDSPELWIRQGILLRQYGDLSTAEQMYRKAVELVPQDSHANYHLAVILYDKQQYAEALQVAEKTLSLPNQNIEILKNIEHLVSELKSKTLSKT